VLWKQAVNREYGELSYGATTTVFPSDKKHCVFLNHKEGKNDWNGKSLLMKRVVTNDLEHED